MSFLPHSTDWSGPALRAMFAQVRILPQDSVFEANPRMARPAGSRSTEFFGPGGSVALVCVLVAGLVWVISSAPGSVAGRGTLRVPISLDDRVAAQLAAPVVGSPGARGTAKASIAGGNVLYFFGNDGPVAYQRVAASAGSSPTFVRASVDASGVVVVSAVPTGSGQAGGGTAVGGGTGTVGGGDPAPGGAPDPSSSPTPTSTPVVPADPTPTPAPPVVTPTPEPTPNPEPTSPPVVTEVPTPPSDPTPPPDPTPPSDPVPTTDVPTAAIEG